MQLDLYPIQLNLKDSFKIAHDQRRVQESLIVKLSAGGQDGLGEATANNFFGIKRGQIMADLEELGGFLAELKPMPPEDFHKLLAPLLRHDSFALCALDVAMHDLWGKIQQQYVWQYWDLKMENVPLTDYTIGIDTHKKMRDKMLAFPWPIYKIKLGTKEDVEIVRYLRNYTQSIFRVDANCAWTADEAIQNAEAFKNLGVEFIEQPLAKDDWDGMQKVFAQSVLPIIADESCRAEEDVEKCHGYFHGVNIKLMKCGGLTVARRMIAKARSLNMKVMLGCMTESSVGISAISQLLPLLDYVDMDGQFLIADDPASGVQIHKDGRISYAGKYGTGAFFNG